MRITTPLARLLLRLYFSKPVRLFSARARGSYHLSKADRARDEGDWAAAAAHYWHSLQEFTQRHDLWIQLGNVRKEVGDLAGSRSAYEAALALSADNSDLALQLGHLTKIQGHVDEARNWYLKAVQLDPRNQAAFDEFVALGEDLSTLLAARQPLCNAGTADADLRSATPRLTTPESLGCEPPRDSRRLQLLRRWSHDEQDDEQVLTRDP